MRPGCRSAASRTHRSRRTEPRGSRTPAPFDRSVGGGGSAQQRSLRRPWVQLPHPTLHTENYTNICLERQVNLPRILDLQPPCQLLTRCKQGRGHCQVRTIPTTSRRLDGDVVIAAQVAVTHPHPDIWRQELVPPELNCRP